MTIDCYLLLQRHDIIKKRIDVHGNVIETRQEGIGHPAVSKMFFFFFRSGVGVGGAIVVFCFAAVLLCSFVLLSNVVGMGFVF